MRYNSADFREIAVPILGGIAMPAELAWRAVRFLGSHPFVALATVVLLLLLGALLGGLAILVLRVVAGLSSRGEALRPLPEGASETEVELPLADLPLFKRWYIESDPASGPAHSCSFVEFDERGDYLDFAQHRQAYLTIMKLAESSLPLTLVVYVHGWRHSGQSRDVLAFNEFLHQLAGADEEGHPRRRVHGVYVAWRGSSLHPAVPDDDVKARVESYFHQPLIDPARAARVAWLNPILESLGYFSRKSIPEHKFAGTALARTLFTCAYAAKRSVGDRQVILMGHSFGALMLERAFQNAAIGQLTDKWPFAAPKEAGKKINPLPFDSVLLLNSAAPSIYAKQFQSYLAAHRQAMAKAHVAHANTPFMFSMTSAADWATGLAHPIANALCFLVPTLWRKYRGADFILDENGPKDVKGIPQSYYYRHTPGHNPLLVNRFIEPVTSANDGSTASSHVRHNLSPAKTNPFVFQIADGHGKSQEWRIAFPPTANGEFDKFSMYKGIRPVAWTKAEDGRLLRSETAYWIIRCPKDIIAGHNEIWSQAAMDTYAALHRIALGANVVDDKPLTAD